MTSESQKKANRKYEIEKTENIRIRVPIGKKGLIQQCAKMNNESINGMVNRLIDEELKRKKFKQED